MSPLSPEAREILETCRTLHPPADAKLRVSGRISEALASGGVSLGGWWTACASAASAVVMATAVVVSTTPSASVDEPLTPVVEQEPEFAQTRSMPVKKQRPSRRQRFVSGQTVSPSEEKPRSSQGSSSSLSAEVRILSKARAAIRDGSWKRAIEAAQQHAQSFPDGVLSQERVAIFAMSACELGDREGGLAWAEALADIAPDSPHLESVARHCQ